MILDRTLLFAVCAIVATVNARVHHAFVAVARDGFWTALAGLFNSSAILWFALYALFVIGTWTREGARLRSADWGIIAAMMLASLLPFPAFAALALLGAGGWLWWDSVPETDSRRVAIIILAISGHIVVGRVALMLFSGPLLALDAQAVAWMGGTTASENVVTFVGGGRFVVSGTCSSLHNMSLAVLCWATLAQLARLRIDARLVGYLGASLFSLFVVNTLRLAAIARMPEHFIVLHHGWGATLFGWASLLVVMLVSAMGVLDAARRQI